MEKEKENFNDCPWVGLYMTKKREKGRKQS